MQVANQIEGKTAKDCQKRHQIISQRTQATHKEWTVEEDVQIMLLVKKHGENWKNISVEFQKNNDFSNGLRSEFQIRERYTSILDPKLDLKKSRKLWTPEETKTLVDAVTE